MASSTPLISLATLPVIPALCAINLDCSDVQIRERKVQGLGRNEVAIGDVVGFVDRDQNQRTGKIIRLNDKTVSLQCGGTQWRVAYAYLHRVVDADMRDLLASHFLP